MPSFEDNKSEQFFPPYRQHKKYYHRLAYQQRTHGAKARWITRPPLHHFPNKFTPPDKLIEEAIALMTKNHWIREVKDWKLHPGFYSKLKVIRKKTGKMRITLACVEVNKFTEKITFRCDDLRSAKQMIRVNDFMYSRDLSDAFHQNKLHLLSQPFFRFAIQLHGKIRVYQYLVTPQGWSSSPRIHHINVMPALEFARSQGLQVSIATDDILGTSRTKLLSLQHGRKLNQILNKYNWTRNQMKDLNGTQQIEWYGAIISTRKAVIFSTPRKKITKYIQDVKRTIRKHFNGTLTTRNLAGTLGKLISCHMYLDKAKSHTLNLRNCLTDSLKATKDWDSGISLTELALAELDFFLTRAHWTPVIYENNLIEIRIATDASTSGWGAYVLSCPKHLRKMIHHQARGFWEQEEASLHINHLELKVPKTAFICMMTKELKLFLQKQRIHINWLIDNTTALAYVNNRGGNKPALNREAQVHHTYFRELNIVSTGTWIPTKENIQADGLSRIRRVGEELSLHQRMFRTACRHFKMKPTLDLFATHLNHKIDRFCSAFPEPRSLGNAYSRSWEKEKPYLFPPLTQITRTLNKLILDKTKRAIAILPINPRANWWPVMLELLVARPLLIRRPLQNMSSPNEKLQSKRGLSTWSWCAVCLSASTSQKLFLSRWHSNFLEPNGRIPHMELHRGRVSLNTTNNTKVSWRLREMNYFLTSKYY